MGIEAVEQCPATSVRELVLCELQLKQGAHQQQIALLRGEVDQAIGQFLSLVDESAHGTKALRTEKFVNEPLPIPPADEQIEILEFIQAETAKVDELIEHTRVHIDALREFESALISEAVTGQIDVRGYTAAHSDVFLA